MKHNIVLGLSIICLVLFYVFQKNIFHFFNLGEVSAFSQFVFSKTIRFIVNDLLMIGVIYGLYKESKYVKIAFIVQVAGLVTLLLPYLLIKYYFMGYNGPLISFLHRLVLNPLLMILLIPAFYYQRIKQKEY